MSIERKCKNCEMFDQSTMEEKLGWCWDKGCDVLGNSECYDNCFRNEKLVRQDERSKFIELLKSDLENLDLTDYDNSQVLENYAIKDYIEKTIELLEKEQ